VWQLQELWRFLLFLSIPLFFLDVAIRRITVSKEQISELRSRLRLPEREEALGSASTLMNLKHRKEGIWGRSGMQDAGLRTIKDEEARAEEVERERTPVSSPVLPSASPTATESEETYTSRLLKAKKRAEQNKQ
jgi:hypothetical protein